jgi:hypothetical protein
MYRSIYRSAGVQTTAETTAAETLQVVDNKCETGFETRLKLPQPKIVKLPQELPQL